MFIANSIPVNFFKKYMSFRRGTRRNLLQGAKAYINRSQKISPIVEMTFWYNGSFC
jgi:hypothetical protein